MKAPDTLRHIPGQLRVATAERAGGKGRGQTCTGACVCNLFEQIDAHEQRHSLTGVDDHLEPQTISMHGALAMQLLATGSVA